LIRDKKVFGIVKKMSSKFDDVLISNKYFL